MSHIGQPKKYQIENGLRVILDPMPSLHSATVSLWVDGSHYPAYAPSPYPYGVAHFLEHLLFKESQKMTSFRQVQDIEASGGQMNAMTDKETTCYYAQVLSEEVDTALNILAHMAQPPQFTQDDITLERQVITHEIRTGQNATDTRILETLIQTLWQPHPLSQPVIGTEMSISAMTPAMLHHYHQTVYTPNHMILSIAGRFNPETILTQVQSAFDGLPASSSAKSNKSKPNLSPPYTPCRMHLYPEDPQATLCLLSKGIEADSPQRFALAVLDMLLGGGISSRLFKNLRQEKGLVYSIHTFELLYRYTGLFGVFAQTHPDQLNTVYPLILDTLEALTASGPTADELERAKRKISGTLRLNLESTRYRASRNARTEIYQETQPDIKTILQQIQAVSVQEIRALCQQLLIPENLSCGYTGSVSLHQPEAVQKS